MNLLSIIVPVYNEKNTILTVVQKALEVPLPKDFSREIIIVDDGSTDGTRESLNRFKSDSHVRIFPMSQNQGKTAAVVKGLEEARGEVLLIQDADLEYDPKYYPALLEPIIAGKSKVVYGSRFMGKIQGMTFINRWANRLSCLTINSIFHTKITDFHTGFKVFRKEVLVGIQIRSRHFSIDTELTVKILKNGFSILEIPIDYRARTKEEGKKITWAKAIESYCELLKHSFQKSA